MKKIPMRRCLATGESLPKNQLIRVVKNNNNEVFVDLTLRANGRGAYIKKSLEAVSKAQKSNCLGRALEIAIPESIYLELEQLVKNS